MARTYWVILTERNGVSYEESFRALADIIEYTARLKGFHRMVGKPMPPAHARNTACQTFFNNTPDPQPDDTLVMLDADHVMPVDLVQRLAAHTVGVVGALATSRGEPPFICAFKKTAAGTYANMTSWEEGELSECTIVGTGAIAIKRWVLQKLIHCSPSWFRYGYGGYNYEATEDMYFGYECEKAGIPHHVDTSLWIPHCTVAYTTPLEWKEYVQDHPEVREIAVANNRIEVDGGGDKWANIQNSIKRTL